MKHNVFKLILLNFAFSAQIASAYIELGPNPAGKLPTNDPFLSYQWSLVPQGQSSIRDLDDIHLWKRPVAQKKKPIDLEAGIGWVTPSSGVLRKIRIAVLDSGVDRFHDDLQSVLLKGKSFVEADPDRNKLYEDNVRHGTHVISLIAAEANNGIGIAGVAGEVEILPIRVYDNTDEEKGQSRLEQSRHPLPKRIALALDFALKNKVDIINMSLGWPRVEHNPDVKAALKKVLDQGVLIVAAAGNDGHDGQIFPCAISGVICVGSLDVDGKLALGSNRGGHVDLYAPGSDILGAIPLDLPSYFFGPKGYDYLSGTSQAAPLVTGALAVAMGKFPEMSKNELVARMLGNAKILESGERALSLAAFIKGEKTPLVARPNFKEIEFIVRKGLNVEVEIPWVQKLKFIPKVRVQVLEPQGSYQVTSTRSSKAKVKLRFRAKNDRVHSRLKIRMLVNGVSFESSFFVVSPLKTKAQSRLPQSDLFKDLGLESVPNLFGDQSMSYWSSVELTGDEGESLNQILIAVWEQSSSEIDNLQFKGKSRVFEKTSSFLGNYRLAKIDWDLDGKPEYLIGLIEKKEEGSPIFHFHYLDRELKTVYDFELNPEGQFSDFKSLDDYLFAPHVFEGQKILVPVSWERGRVSRADQNKDFFDFEDNPESQRLYYLEPKVQTDNAGTRHQFVTRTLIHPRMEKKLRAQLGTDFTSDIFWVGPLTQSAGTYNQGSLTLVGFVGRGVIGSNIAIQFSDLQSGEFELQRLEKTSGFDLTRQSFSKAWKIGQQIDEWPEIRLFYSFYMGRSLIFNREESEFQKQRLSRPIGLEKIAGVVQSYLGPEAGDRLALLETSDYFRIVGSWAGRAVNEKQLVYRSTFTPGELFTQRLNPVVVGSKQKPGLILDNSGLFSDTFWIYELSELGKFTAPLRNAYELPPQCEIMSPQIGPGAYHRVPVVCTSDRGFELRLVEPQ